MRKCFLSVVLLCAAMMLSTTGCTEKKGDAADTVSVADTVETLKVDTTDTVQEDSIVEAAPMPKAADKLFADFFFDFISKKKVQMNRIQFPLKTTDGNQVRMIERGAWKMERFYQDQEYYTQIFDNERQMEATMKRDVDSVIVEKIRLQEGKVVQYVFKHPEGRWILTEVNTVGMDMSKNASFLMFLQRFFSDQAFQKRHVKSPLAYYGPDPDAEDDSRYVKRNIPASTWTDYLPEIPGDQIYNTLYGQTYGEGNEKIFLFKGISNGLETQLQFKKQGGQWNLIRIKL